MHLSFLHYSFPIYHILLYPTLRCFSAAARGFRSMFKGASCCAGSDRPMPHLFFLNKSCSVPIQWLRILIGFLSMCDGEQGVMGGLRCDLN